jgi:hypothetical protein
MEQVSLEWLQEEICGVNEEISRRGLAIPGWRKRADKAAGDLCAAKDKIGAYKDLVREMEFQLEHYDELYPETSAAAAQSWGKTLTDIEE